MESESDNQKKVKERFQVTPGGIVEKRGGKILQKKNIFLQTARREKTGFIEGYKLNKWSIRHIDEPLFSSYYDPQYSLVSYILWIWLRIKGNIYI